MRATVSTFAASSANRGLCMRKFLVAFLLAGCLVLAGGSPALAKQPYPLNYHSFDLSGGTTNGVAHAGGGLSISSSPAGTFTYTDPYAGFDPIQQTVVDGSGVYDYGTWTSPTYTLSFPLDELVSSWDAQTPVGTCRSPTVARLGAARLRRRGWWATGATRLRPATINTCTTTIRT